MTRLLLDTSFLIDAERSTTQLDAVIDDDDDVAIAAITVAELRVGVLLAGSSRRSRRAAFLGEVLETIPVVEYGSEIAAVHAELLVDVRRQGVPRGAHDLIIAASARSTKRTIVSADTAAFENLQGARTRPAR